MEEILIIRMNKNWVERIQRKNIESFDIGFIVGFDKSYFCGIMDITRYWTEGSHIEFIKSTPQSRAIMAGNVAINFILIWDNNVYHKSKEVYSFIEHEIWWIIIWLYEPWLNPAEKIIQLINMKV